MDCKYFMDFDMAVLGRPWAAYEAYGNDIRQEYGHVPDALFCRARGDFLKTAVTGPAIFATKAFCEAREQQARENMAQESIVLKRRLDTCSPCSRLLSWVLLGLKAQSIRLVGAGLVVVIAGVVMIPKAALATLGISAVLFSLVSCRLLCSKTLRFPYPDVKIRDEARVSLAGSFNPPHHGHFAMLRHLSSAHAKVYAIVGINPSKKYSVSPYVRQELLRAMLVELGLDNVEVVVVAGYIWRWASQNNVSLMYRGIRSWKKDGCGEKFLELQNIFGQAYLGRERPLPAVYMYSDPKFQHLSSTLIRERLVAGSSISDLVPAGCAQMVSAAYG